LKTKKLRKKGRREDEDRKKEKDNAKIFKKNQRIFSFNGSA